MAGEIWEPDALTAHVRICEGANSMVHGSNLVTPPEETGGEQGTQTVFLTTSEFARFTGSDFSLKVRYAHGLTDSLQRQPVRRLAASSDPAKSGVSA